MMFRRNFLRCLALTVAGWSFMSGPSAAQQAADIEAIKAANAAFYAALSARDAKAMESVWANKPYVVNIGPRSKTIAVGYSDAVAKYWENVFTNVFTEISVTMTSTAQVQTDGQMAWVVGAESAVGKLKSGADVAFETFATNIFEKENDRWLMISHHAGMQPK